MLVSHNMTLSSSFTGQVEGQMTRPDKLEHTHEGKDGGFIMITSVIHILPSPHHFTTALYCCDTLRFSMFSLTMSGRCFVALHGR